MTLYSLHNQRPAPLPWRITLPNGFTRTDPSTFTEDEILAAGFTGPYSEPDYDPATQQLDWIDGEYVISTLPPPPPTPDWDAFKRVALSSSTLNQILAQAYQTCPVAAGALAPALLKAEGNGSTDFVVAWSAIVTACSVPPEVLAGFAQAAEDCQLPAEFIAALRPELVRARNADGTFRADDPTTPENEVWVPAQ